MAIYEQRTYNIIVGHMPEVIRLYRDEGAPALEAGGFMEYNVGYFTSDTGTLHELVHLWRFADDSERRSFWKRLFADEAFMAFAAQLRPHIERQQVQLLRPAPWGSAP